MKKHILFLLALVTLGFASSCKQPTDFDTDRWNDKDTTTHPAVQELAGEWYLAYYETFNGMPDSVPNQMYMVNFETSKKVTGKVNCNTLEAEYTAGNTPIGNTPDKALTFKNISTTKMNCGTGTLDAKFTSALAASKQYYVFGDMLEITYTGGGTTLAQRMIFRRKAVPNNNFDLLKGSEWTLVSFEQFGQPAEWIPLAYQQNLNISFLGDSMAVGMAECGKFSAEYFTYNKPLPGTVDYPLGIYITNSVPCNGNYGARFLAALAGAKKYYRYGDSLEITYSADNGITLSRMMFIRKGQTNSGVTILDSSIVVSQMPNTMNLPSAPLTIFRDSSVINGKLPLGLQFYGGCGLHEFFVYGRVLGPGGVELLLTHNAIDNCNSVVQRTVTLDLSTFIAEYKKVTGQTKGQMKFYLTVAGSSQPQRSYGYNF